MGPGSILILIFSGAFFCFAAILVSKFVLKATKSLAKSEPYECGIPVKPSAWVQFPVGYYLFALIFLVFDVELIFLYPWATVVREIGMVALMEIIVFLFVLFLGLLYAHKKGALKWM